MRRASTAATGARPAAAQEGQRSPEVEALPLLVPGARLHDLGAVVEDCVKECLPGSTESVGDFLRLATREDVALLPFGDVGAPPLDEVVREALAETSPFCAHDLGQALEVRIEQTEQPVEGGIVAAMRSRGDQDEVPRCGAG